MQQGSWHLWDRRRSVPAILLGHGQQITGVKWAELRCSSRDDLSRWRVRAALTSSLMTAVLGCTSIVHDTRWLVLRCCCTQVEKELSEICASILQLLDEHLIPTASSGESKVFYLKMKVRRAVHIWGGGGLAGRLVPATCACDGAFVEQVCCMPCLLSCIRSFEGFTRRARMLTYSIVVQCKPQCGG